MQRFRRILPWLLLLAACATGDEAEPPAMPLFVLPYEETPDGHLLVRGTVETEFPPLGAPAPRRSQTPLQLLIDTGSTRSGLTESVVIARGLSEETMGSTLVRGLQSAERRPVIRATLRLGHVEHGPMPIIVLRDRPQFDADGIVGMDVLEGYGMLVDAAEGVIAFGEGLDFAKRRIASWDRIRLRDPPGPSGASLPFVEMRLGRHRFPVLLDTGNAVNVINEDVAQRIAPSVLATTRTRERLEDVNAEETRPPGLIVLGAMLGDVTWERIVMIILPLDALSVIGSQDGPFGIAGIDFLSRRSFALDHRTGMLFLCPEDRQRQDRC